MMYTKKTISNFALSDNEEVQASLSFKIFVVNISCFCWYFTFKHGNMQINTVNYEELNDVHNVAQPPVMNIKNIQLS